MKKFECRGCHANCKLIVKYDDIKKPEKCPYDGYMAWQVVEEAVTDRNQLPKLTVEVFDRPDCPEWAKYAAVDKDGKGFYYQVKPEKQDKIWHDFGAGDIQRIGFFDASDWENSLIERQKRRIARKVQVEKIKGE